MEIDSYFMKIAGIVKLRSGCTRRQVGAVFVIDNRIASTGYNQAPSGAKHCSEEGCTIYDGHCIRAIHAELNGILNATKAGQSLQGSTVYITSYPCLRCLMALRNAGVSSVVTDEPYTYQVHEQGLQAELTKHFTWKQWNG
jgi:dCMP deaminase